MVIDPTDYQDRRQSRRGGREAGPGQRAERSRQRQNAGSKADATLRSHRGGASRPFDSRRATASRKPSSSAGPGQSCDAGAGRTSSAPQIRLAPVNGWVTNLLAQLGDYANVGRTAISLVDADSFWVDGYFEETQLGSIREGDPANVKLMGYSQIVRGHVGSIARGINVSNAQPDQQGLATVNPIFTWVRLAQRVPVRIHIDQVPDGVRLVAGMTATVQIDDRG